MRLCYARAVLRGRGMGFEHILVMLAVWLGSIAGNMHVQNPLLDFDGDVATSAPCGKVKFYPNAASDWLADPRYPPFAGFYPPIASRLHQQGTAIIAVCIMPNGWPGDAVIEKSSGWPQLDAAALISAGNWHFLPAPQGIDDWPQWKDVPVNFALGPKAPPASAETFADAPRVNGRPPANFTAPQRDPAFAHASNYPAIANRHREEGNAIVEMTIEPDGGVDGARILKSSGSRQLDAVALVSVGYWRYFPATENGKPIRARWLARLLFKMPDKSRTAAR